MTYIKGKNLVSKESIYFNGLALNGRIVFQSLLVLRVVIRCSNNNQQRDNVSHQIYVIISISPRDWDESVFSAILDIQKWKWLFESERGGEMQVEWQFGGYVVYSKSGNR